MKYICGNIKVAEPGDPDFIEYLLKIAAEESPYTCPFCGEWYDPDNAEYTYIDLGHYEQVSGNHCENDECLAYELGHYKMAQSQVYFHGWVRDRRPEDGDKYPVPKWVVEEVVQDHALAAKRAQPVEYEQDYGLDEHPSCNKIEEP